MFPTTPEFRHRKLPSVVEESEIETTLKKLQDDMSELTPVEEDRPIKESDFVEISFQRHRPGRRTRNPSPPTRPSLKSAAHPH